MRVVLENEEKRIRSELEKLQLLAKDETGKLSFYLNITRTTIYGQISEPLGDPNFPVYEHLESILSAKNAFILHLEKNGIPCTYHINKKIMCKKKKKLVTKFKLQFKLQENKTIALIDTWWENF